MPSRFRLDAFTSLLQHHAGAAPAFADYMEAPSPNENPPKDFNKIDLTQLQDFSFGTQWTQDKSAPGSPRPDRPRRAPGDFDRPRPDRGPADRDGPRRDRRPVSRPAGPSAGRPEDQPEGMPPRGDGPRPDRPRAENRRGERFAREGGPGRPYAPREPYLSPYFNVVFYPEDTGFAALGKAMRASGRTYELFEIARIVIGKVDRFIVVAQRKPGAEGDRPAPVHVAVPDGMPFESEDAALAYVLDRHLDKFFDVAAVEVDPPKGNFPIINRCTITGELLGPPNYHRYQQIIQQHHAAKLDRMPFERFRERIESVRDPEVAAQWLEKMKKVTRYTWKHAAEGAEAPKFDSLEEARQHLLTQARDQLVKAVENVRFPAKVLETLPPGEIRRAIEGQLERQRRFPLDTANGLRGRLRREGFAIFKKGSKGVSYVCAVKRKFRTPSQTFADSIGALINFIETHPMLPTSELPGKFLGLVPGTSEATPVEGAAVAPAAALTPEQQEKLKRLAMDLRWLVSEGYVTEFSDGRLFTPPPMAEAKKKAAEIAEHDPENFPEIPGTPETTEESSSEESAPPLAVEESPAPVDAATLEAPVPAPAVDADSADLRT